MMKRMPPVEYLARAASAKDAVGTAARRAARGRAEAEAEAALAPAGAPAEAAEAAAAAAPAGGPAVAAGAGAAAAAATSEAADFPVTRRLAEAAAEDAGDAIGRRGRSGACGESLNSSAETHDVDLYMHLPVYFHVLINTYVDVCFMGDAALARAAPLAASAVPPPPQGPKATVPT